MFRFPWGDFHSLNLGWFLQKFNELREDWATAEAGIDGALDAEIQKAEDALTDVFAARDAAAASASAANSSALNASQSSLASMDARDQSRAARDAAQQAAGNAAASETAAGNSATAASNSAGAAATSATQAGNSATAAGNSATAAGQSATNAAASETAAGNSAAAAAASETAAGQSATDAEEAAASVEASAQQIATNASDILALKDALNNSNNGGIPYIDTTTIIDKVISGTMRGSKFGNTVLLNGSRTGNQFYLNLNTLNNMADETATPELAYRDSLEEGFFIFTLEGQVESPNLTGVTVAISIVEQNNETDLAYWSTSVKDFKDGTSVIMQVPTHTNPVGIRLYCRFQEYINFKIYSKFVNSKEIASLQALILENH